MVLYAVVFGVALLAAIFCVARVASAHRSLRPLRRIGPPTVDLEGSVGKRVALSGRLAGGDSATFYPARIETIEDVDTRAMDIDSSRSLSIESRGHVVAIEGPVQVVVGTREARTNVGGESGKVRRAFGGDPVVAEGVVQRAAGPTADHYRDPARSFVLVGPPDDRWPLHPVALFSRARGGRAMPAIAAVAALAVSGTVARIVLSHRVEEPVAAGVPPRPPCVHDVEAFLDQNDPWRARDRLPGCSDPLVAAETDWMLGEFGPAADLYAEARALRPDSPITASEVQATIFADANRGAALLRKAKGAWYKGPADTAQENIDCVADDLAGHPRVTGCYSLGPQRHARVGSEAGHGMPNYALHDPPRYFRLEPSAEGTRCTSSFHALERLAAAVCFADSAVVRAIFEAVAGEGTRLDQQLRSADEVLAALEELDAHPPTVQPADMPYGGGTPADALASERDQRTYDGQRILAVGAEAAWVGHDLRRARSYLPYISAHERAILGEHLDLVEGKARSPDSSHSPSDYSDVDMEMFAAVGSLSPDEFTEKLRGRNFTSPVRLAALVAAKPAYLAALRPWVEHGFSPVCRSCGAYALFDAAFRRREVARLVGSTELEARLLEVTKKFGTALRTWDRGESDRRAASVAWLEWLLGHD